MGVVSSVRAVAHYCPFAAYAASVASLCGRHQSWWSLVPLDRVGEAGLEVGERRHPAELGAQLAGVDGVAQVVAGPVGDVVEGVLAAAHQRRISRTTSRFVLLALGADQVGLADPAAARGSSSTAELWSSAWIQSRTFSPLP